MRNFNLPAFGGGAGLQAEYWHELLESRLPFRWFEVQPRDIAGAEPSELECFQELRKHYRVVMHGLGLLTNSPLDLYALRQMADLAEQLDTPWLSDSPAFSSDGELLSSELPMLRYTERQAKEIVERMKVIQDLTQRPFLLKNITRYYPLSDQEMPESEFLSMIVEDANCGLLLDISSIYQNSVTHDFDAYECIRNLPLSRVGEIHLSGADSFAAGMLENQELPLPPDVWDLYRKTIALSGPTSVLIAWESFSPALDRMHEEAEMLDQAMNEITEMVEAEKQEACV